MRKGIGYVMLAGALGLATLYGCQTAPKYVAEPKPVVAEAVTVEDKKQEAVEVAPVVEEKKVEAIKEEPKVESLPEPVLPKYEPPVFGQTAYALMDYLRQVEPNLDSLYATFSPAAQDFGYKFLKLTEDTFDKQPEFYKNLVAGGLEQMVKGDVEATINAGKEMFLASPQEEQEAILAVAKKYNNDIYNLATENPAGAEEFQKGLLNWYSMQNPVLQKNLELMVGGMGELGVNLF
jgi:hypothetical protein